MVALKSTSSRRPIPTPLHQPALHYLYEGLMWSADLQKDVEQLQLLVRRVEVDQLDDEDDRQTRPPTILRDQQRYTELRIEHRGRRRDARPHLQGLLLRWGGAI